MIRGLGQKGQGNHTMAWAVYLYQVSELSSACSEVLFTRLYGMFPCNFLSYLRTQYSDNHKEQQVRFNHAFALLFCPMKHMRSVASTITVVRL